MNSSEHTGLVRLTLDGGLKFSPQVTTRGEEVIYTLMATPKLFRLMRLKLGDRSVEPWHRDAPKSELDPAVSVDGRYLAFVQLRGVLSLALVIRDLQAGSDGGVPPASGFAGMRSPAIAPDGKRVLYCFAGKGSQHIYSVDMQGGDRRMLTAGVGIDNWPCYSPDGKWVVFGSSRRGKFDVWVMSADGGNLRRLTDSPRQDIRPRFSPDGRRIAFTSHRDGRPRVYVMNADGSAVKRLETGSEGDDFPTWHPDGRRLLFVSEVAGQRDLVLMDALA
jgi:TolB protein